MDLRDRLRVNGSTINNVIQTPRVNMNKTASNNPGRFRRFGAALLATLLLASAATNALAALIAYEPYNYTIGAAPTFVSGTPSQTAGGGFSSGYNGGGLTTVAGLTYSGLGVNFNALKQTAAYSGENVSSPVSSGTVYVSYLFNMPGNPGGNKVGLEMNTGGNGMFVGVTTPVTGTTGKLGVNQQQGYNDSFANKWESSTANITYGSTYFIVVKLVRNGANWDGSIWVNPTANTATETPASPDGTFTMPGFTISACSIVNPAGAGGNFTFDELRIGTTWADAVNYTIAPPGTPTGLAATPGNNSVSLTWTAPAGSPASYNVKRSTTSGSGYVTVSTLGAVTGTSFTDNVVGGTTYYYVVSAVNAGGESANSSEVSAAPTLAAPAAPAGLSANASDAQVTLNWSASVAATGYNVKRSTSSGTEVTIATTASTSYTDSTVVNGTTYFYVVSATNSVGEGANSSEVTASPIAYVAVYEPFNYTVGNLANNTPGTGAGETGNWVIPTGVPTIVSPGLTYAGLPVANNAYKHTATGNQNYINLATASQLSSGTKYISYLMKGTGNSGGDTVGAYFKGNNSTSLFAGFRAPNSATLTGFSLGSVNSATLGGASALGSTINITNNVEHLIVIKIDFNTSGVNDTVSLWIDPPAGTNAPGVAANSTVSTFDVGTISAIGINIQGGYAAQFDEFRTGNSYGDVVGYTSGATPTIPTTVSISVAQGTQVSWSAQSTNSYQPQKSSDNINWTNIGSLLAGNAVTAIYETSPQPYYRVLEVVPGAAGANAIGNPSFEIPDANSTGAVSWSGPANGVDGNGNTVAVYVTNSWNSGTLNPVEGTNLLYMEGATPTSGPVTPPNVSLQSDLFPVTGGLPYHVQFSAANPVKVGGANPQYRISYYTAGDVYISDSGFISFASAGSSWATFSITNTAPANAAKAQMMFIQALGAGNNFNWVSLIDNLTVNSLYSFAGTNVLTPVLKLGAVFTGTVKTNGVTATGTSGTITFYTNNVTLSTNSVAAGSANSGTGIITPPYTVKAVYSGDNTYIGSTNTLTVNNAIAIVTLGSLLQTNDGTAKPVTVVTTPAGLTVNVTYDGSSNAPTNAGTYQVIGTVSDALYVGSATNSLVIVPGTSNNPTNITVSVSGNQLTLAWPADHLGWVLQTQTNDLSAGLSGNWVDVPGSEASTSAVITIEAANPSVFFRLRSP